MCLRFSPFRNDLLSMQTIKAGGVPEHFNLPWNLVVENKILASSGIDLTWKECHGGTGEMTQALRSGELDIAVLLTEGITADILHGNPSKIVQFYVNSPLRWGIHVRKGANIKSIDDLRGKKYAISRLKSGSHLMAYVNALHHGLPISNKDFVIVNNLDGGRKALAEGTADVFFWEKFTTQPYVDNGEFECIGECPTPWPCFVVAAREDVIKNNERALEYILCAVNEQAALLKENATESIAQIADRFALKHEETEKWFNQLSWNVEGTENDAALTEVLEKLRLLGVITNEEAKTSLDSIREYINDFACAS